MSLTEVSYYSRKLAPFAILIIIVIFIVFYSFRLLFLVSEVNKPKVVDINPVFKELKPIEMPPEATNSGGFSYIIDTVDGEPVTASDTGKVFFLPKNQARFGYREKIYLLAKNLGFDTEVTKHQLVNGTTAVFADEKRHFTIDITNFNFKYDLNLATSPELFEKNNIPDKDTAQNRAIDFLKSCDRYPDDLQKGRTNVIFLQYDKVSSRTAVLEKNDEANMVEVDFYRADIDEYPIVSPKYFNSQNYVTMVVADGEYRVVSSQIKFFERSDAQVGIYPIIDGRTAYEKLQKGKGYIISGAKLTQNEIAIKRMFLGYYDPDTYQSYLQPVYVFLGDNNFVSYVPAVTDQYVIDMSKL